MESVSMQGSPANSGGYADVPPAAAGESIDDLPF
jgi:hypothetical protein